MKKINDISLIKYYVNTYNLFNYLNNDLLNCLELHEFSKDEFLCTLNS